MIPTTAYILISTLISGGDVTQTTATFYDKPSCESAAQRGDFIYREMHINGRWNLTCMPYIKGETK